MRRGEGGFATIAFGSRKFKTRSWDLGRYNLWYPPLEVAPSLWCPPLDDALWRIRALSSRNPDTPGHHKTRKCVLLKLLVSLIRDNCFAGRDDIFVANVTGLRPHVHDDFRRLKPCSLHGELSSLIRSAAARGNGIRARGSPQQIRVSNRGTNGIGIGISVTENVNRHLQGLVLKNHSRQRLSFR